MDTPTNAVEPSLYRSIHIAFGIGTLAGMALMVPEAAYVAPELSLVGMALQVVLGLVGGAFIYVFTRFNTLLSARVTGWFWGTPPSSQKRHWYVSALVSGMLMGTALLSLVNIGEPAFGFMGLAGLLATRHAYKAQRDIDAAKAARDAQETTKQSAK